MITRHRVLIAIALAVVAWGRADAQRSDVDPRVRGIVDAISEQRLKASLQQLTSFTTRNLVSDPRPEGRGIGAAREWILSQFRRASPRLQASFETYQVAAQGDRIKTPVELRNVIAVLPGRTARRLYVTAHYDTVARVPSPTQPDGVFNWALGDNPSPGADDDGSGTVLVLELARAFAQSGVDFDATLVFGTFAGEEQGLVGSTLHATKARADGAVIDAVLNNDIVGGVAGGDGVANGDVVRVFSEEPADSPSRQLARYVRDAAARYVPSHRVELVARYDRFGRGGDHTPFNQRGFAAVRVTEAFENYARQHSATDSIDDVSFAYLARNAKVNAAALASLALAPAAPRVTDDRGRPQLTRGTSGYDAQLTWRRSPGAAGYRVYWRRTWSPDWQQHVDVGDVEEYLLRDVSIDDYVFGVSALGPAGDESLVAAYVNPIPQPSTIKTIP